MAYKGKRALWQEAEVCVYSELLRRNYRVMQPGRAKDLTQQASFMCEDVTFGLQRKTTMRHDPDPEELAAAILAGDTIRLARGITLIESEAPRHEALAERLVQLLLPNVGGAMRVGITGVPGVGKSSLIEALGCWLCDNGRRVAVLAVDPTSSLTGGSILGDKTRMEQLSRRPNAFIRPSPSGRTLGGVARKSRETLLLCEAAGFDVVLVETVGVGQSETTVRSMVDLFLLLALTGAGDDLQGIKKGIMELADLIAITKADGDNKLRAQKARAELEQVLHFLHPATEGWSTPVITCSSHDGMGIGELWVTVEKFFAEGHRKGWILRRRHEQLRDWFRSLLEEAVLRRFFADAKVNERLPQIEEAVLAGKLGAVSGVRELIRAKDS